MTQWLTYSERLQERLQDTERDTRVQHYKGVTTTILTAILRAKHYIIGWYRIMFRWALQRAWVAEVTIIPKPILQLNLLFIRPGIGFDSQNCSLAWILFHKLLLMYVRAELSVLLWICFLYTALHYVHFYSVWWKTGKLWHLAGPQFRLFSLQWSCCLCRGFRMVRASGFFFLWVC